MREMALAAKRRWHKPVGTMHTKGASVAPNLLNREFEAQAPNRKWVSDTTYVWTTEGWQYVAVILDLSLSTSNVFTTEFVDVPRSPI